jgi:hypothetical protein
MKDMESFESHVNAACENICDGGGTVEEHARLLVKDHEITFERAVRAIEGALEEDPCADDGDDGPAGDFLNDYWFTAGGPDEPPEMGGFDE